MDKCFLRTLGVRVGLRSVSCSLSSYHRIRGRRFCKGVGGGGKDTGDGLLEVMGIEFDNWGFDVNKEEDDMVGE